MNSISFLFSSTPVQRQAASALPPSACPETEPESALHGADTLDPSTAAPLQATAQPAESPRPAPPPSQPPVRPAPGATLLAPLEPSPSASTQAWEECNTRLSSFESGYTRMHMRRTASYATDLSQALEGTPLQLSAAENRQLLLACEVFDAGKLAVDESLWNDPRGPRDMPADEWKAIWQQMCRHVDVSTESSRQAGKPGDAQVETVLMSLSSKISPEEDGVRAIVRHHHEKLDGSGYPDGLKGEQIPKGAQLLAICDMYEALRSPRSFRQPKEYAVAREIIEADAARGLLNGEMVKAFFERVVPEDDQAWPSF